MGRMIQNNFSGGILSPSLYGRSDLQAYYKGAAVAENFVVAKEGSLRKRHGITSRLALPEYANCKIVPYKYDRTLSRLFVFEKRSVGESYELAVRMYAKDGTLVSWTENVGGTNTTVSERVISNFTGDVKRMQSKQIGDQVWITTGDFLRIVNVYDAESFDIVEWSQSEAPDAIVHDDTESTQSTHWSIVRSTPNSGKTLYYGVIGVKDSVNSDTSKGEVAWSSSWVAGQYIDIKITIAVADCAKWDYVIVAKRAGGSYGELTRHYMDDNPDEHFNASMTAIYKSTYRDALFQPLFFLTQTVYKWTDGKYYDKAEGQEGAVEQTPQTVAYKRWNFRDDNISPGDAVYGQTNTLGEGFCNPLCVDCFQQRRVFANATTDGGGLPMTLWFSEVGNLNNFYADRPSTDDDPFSPTISSTGPAFVRWIVSYDEMLILLTDCGLFSVGFSQTSGFSASSCRICHFSDLAVSPTIQPVVTDAGIVFVADDNKTLYTAAYDINENKLKPINRSVLVEHLTRTSQIKAVALQTSPDNVVWVVMENGRYATFTFERNEEVYAWSDGFVEGCAIEDVVSLGSVTDSSSDRTYGDLIFVVGKDGTDYLCTPNTGYADAVGGVSTNVVATLRTLRPESQDRTIVGRQKNVKDIIIRLYKTGGIAVKSADGGTGVPLVDARMTLDGEGLFTGEVKVMPNGVVTPSGQMTYVSDNAKPCEVLQIVTSLEVAQ